MATKHPAGKPLGRPPGSRNRLAVALSPEDLALAKELVEVLGYPWTQKMVAQAALRLGLLTMKEKSQGKE